MNEESQDTITEDDISVLRLLLHTVKGISAVSTTDFAPDTDTTKR